MKVRDIMTSPVVCVEPAQGISEAIQLMLERRISGLPVTTPQGELIGIVTEGDLLRRHELGSVGAHSWLKDLFLSPGRRAEEYVHTHGRKVANVMTDQPVTIEPDARLSDAIDMMTVHHVRRLPVIENGRVIGILARADVLRALLPLASEPPDASDDGAIREAVEAALDRALGTGMRETMTVETYRGAVILSGAVTDERLIPAAQVAAENTPGVVSVTNQLIVVGPFVGASVPAPPF
ncbi:CBS domain-containing protein [Gluconacetobacter takamatsuzukensis]|uniref:CBS domain-containing protein n=1 Tax=Gluconacetobacter takamatsuzukensis TaxID=1286190 RepID=A0A7W4PPP8_9PROT|nr:CBS domain-containing protein [Gluconacetobacter takamatsuzukensis]MBB2205463.1 CBS domain-containing protein [Gluconacetobacter takamatsuzukensis]